MTAILLLPFVLALALMGRLWRWPRIWLLPFLLIPAFFLRGIVGELSVTSVVLLGWLAAGKPLLIPGWLRSVWLLLGGVLYLGFFGLLPWDGYAMGFGVAWPMALLVALSLPHSPALGAASLLAFLAILIRPAFLPANGWDILLDPWLLLGFGLLFWRRPRTAQP